MATVKRQLVIVTHQALLPDVNSGIEGFPMRKWNMELFLVHAETGQHVPANAFERAIFHLHPSFEKRQKQIKTTPPFRIEEQGWGEFDMTIVLVPVGKGPQEEIKHDLNFAQERYEAKHEVTFKNPKPELLAILRNSGPVPDANSTGKPDTGKRKRPNKNVDMEKLADGLQKLDEESLLHVVQLVHDNKTPETYAKNDVENGEFHVDLYTLPDQLVKMLWDFAESKQAL